MTSILGILVLLLALYLAVKVLESALKALGWVLVLVAGYWLAAPSLGWPALPDVMQLAWQDLEAFALPEWLLSLWEQLRLTMGTD